MIQSIQEMYDQNRAKMGNKCDMNYYREKGMTWAELSVLKVRSRPGHYLNPYPNLVRKNSNQIQTKITKYSNGIGLR